MMDGWMDGWMFGATSCNVSPTTAASDYIFINMMFSRREKEHHFVIIDTLSTLTIGKRQRGRREVMGRRLTPAPVFQLANRKVLVTDLSRRDEIAGGGR
jgi:hypothetical protein